MCVWKVSVHFYSVGIYFVLYDRCSLFPVLKLHPHLLFVGLESIRCKWVNLTGWRNILRVFCYSHIFFNEVRLLLLFIYLYLFIFIYPSNLGVVCMSGVERLVRNIFVWAPGLTRESVTGWGTWQEEVIRCGAGGRKGGGKRGLEGGGGIGLYIT